MFIKPDTLVEVTDMAFIARGEYIAHGAVKKIAVDESTWEPLFMVALMQRATGLFHEVPFFKGQIRRKPSDFNQLAEILLRQGEQERLAA